MRFKSISFLGLFLFILLLFVCSTSAEVVYDSLDTSMVSSIGVREIGNTVTLSGSKRFVTGVTINVGGPDGQADDYILRLYSPSAPGDYPGKLLWQSGPMGVVHVGEVQPITFELPHIRVPDTFIFSIMDAGDGYFPLCYGPTVGSSPDYCWTNLTKRVFGGANHLQSRIAAEAHPDSELLAYIEHDAWSGIGDDDYYSMEFGMELGGYWDMFGPSFLGVTEWDESSFLHIDADELPEAAEYLCNGVDEFLMVKSESSLKGNVESDTLVKLPGIAEAYPDLAGCVISDFVIFLETIIIDHSTPGWTYFTSDVRWEIWGRQKGPDLNFDGEVNFFDYSILSFAWDSEPGDEHWEALCDINLPGDGHIDVNDLQVLCSAWLSGYVEGFNENFETGDFSSYDWQHAGDAFWNVVSDEFYEGSYSAESGNINDNQSSEIEVEIEVDGETISFYRKVSSESGYDFLHFYIDDIKQDNWSGEVGWSQAAFPVSSGLHTFKWAYTKDVSVSNGGDCAWVDKIEIE